MASVVRSALFGNGKGSMTPLLEWVDGIIAPNGVGGQRMSGEGQRTKRVTARNSPRANEVRTGACCKKCYEIFRSQFRSILGKNATKLDNLINEFLKIRSILGYEIS